MKYYLLAIIVLVVTLVTIIGLFPGFSRSFFAGGSIESSMEMIASNIFLKFFLLLVFSYFLFTVFVHYNSRNLILFICFFFLWVMSGRTIGIFPDGKIKTGWFYFETNEFNVCVDDKTDCQTITDYQTTVAKKFFWRVQVKNKQVNHNVFIGPIVWYPGLKMLNKQFGAGKYTP